MPNRTKKLLGQGPGGDPNGRFAGTGPFQNRADRREILDRAAQIAVSRPRPVEIVHLVDLEVLVGHHQGDRAAKRRAAPDAGEDFDVIGFDLLPAAAAVSALPPREFGVDRFDVEFDSGGKAVDQGEQRPAVRFTGGKVA